MEDFCGEENPFWNVNLTWNTDTPKFTECFQDTLLIWVPSLIMVLLSALELRKFLKSKQRDIPWNIFNVTKIVFTCVLIALTIVQLVDTVDDNNEFAVDSAKMSESPIRLVSFIWSLVMLLLAKKFGVFTSSMQFMFYFLTVISSSIILRSKILNYKDDPNYESKELLVYISYYVIIVAMFFLNCWSDSRPSLGEKISAKPSPQLRASFFSRLVYSWFTPMAWSGFRKPLESKQLWDMIPEYTSKEIVPIFDSYWNAGKKNLKAVDTTNEPSKPDEEKKPDDWKKIPYVSIIPVLVKSFGLEYLVGSFLKAVADVLGFVSPQILKLLIGFVENDTEPWKGFFYAGLMLATTILASIVTSQYFEYMFMVGMHVRTSLISSIYRKALRLSVASKKESTVGETVNLMSVDVQRFMDLTVYLNGLWSAPFQIAIGVYFLYQELGNATFVGLAVMVVMIPLNAFLGYFSRRFQIAQMKDKDARVKMMNEILNGMKVLKLYAWEPSFEQQINDIRKNEIKTLKKSGFLGAFINFIWTSVPFLVLFSSFATYVSLSDDNVLTPSKAFVSLSLLNLIRIPMAMLPFLIVGLVQVTVSVDRVNKFLNSEELDPNAVQNDMTEKDPIIIRDGNFSWGKDEDQTLKDINVSIEKGSLTAVVGTVGAGKSSLISAMLGEMEKLSGSVNVYGKIAYVPQQAWIQNATVQDNITFGTDYEQEEYESIVDACALRTDFNILAAGDQTEIGEKGINLSGGQKQRVSLARAVYSNANIYLFDDPLSAVDSHVGKHLFEKVIGPTGRLRNTTRVLVTHGLNYLPKTDKIIVLKNGQISEAGTYAELLAKKGDFAEFLLQYLLEDNEDNEEIKTQLEKTMGKTEFERQVSIVRRDSIISVTSDKVENDREHIFTTQISKSPSEKPTEMEEKKDQKDVAGKVLIEEEKSETGSVGLAVYYYYIRSIGLFGTLFSVGVQVFYQVCSVGTNVWLNIWSSNKLATDNQTLEELQDVYLGVYAAFGFTQSILTLILAGSLAFYTLNASKLMHSTMLKRVLQSPMSFFDTTPIGRIVNRFSKDIDVCDATLPMVIRSWMNTLANFVGTIILITSIIPIFIVIIIPIAIVFFFVQKIYVSTSRQLKRLESVSRSPIYSHFGETVTGGPTIRAFGIQENFIQQSEEKVDSNQRCYYPSIIANRWLAVRLETIGNLVTFLTAIFAIVQRNDMDSATVGLIITYALNVTQVLNWLVRMTSDVETNIVAVERIKEYSTIEQEASWNTGVGSNKNWLTEGNVQFEKYSMRYREGLDLVVKNITCNIEGGETVGIVGRTGAGKSSLTVAIFRIVEAAGGRIVIDGKEISKLGLHELRNQLTIIPQDPVLFSGTVRINLDPFGQYSDTQVWAALQLSHLKDFVSSLAKGLDHEVSEGGENFSVGQRQLFCLARALLRKTKILVLDEATAAVDLETDELIQKTIRQEFQGCTVLTIAHRLNTILDYDKIMVLDKGEISEFDSPNNLLEDEESMFHSMAKDAGLV